MDLAIGVLLGSGIAWSTICLICLSERRKHERPPSYVGPWCAECGQPFTEFEWENRHTRYDGEDVHADCCFAPKCEIARWAA